MFIGGEKARLLREGAHTLPITAQVPMTPIEHCVVNGDQEGVEACRAALRHVPAPQVPDVHLIFHPAGLSNSELEKLAELATSEALDTLRQALAAQKKRVRFIQELLLVDCDAHQCRTRSLSARLSLTLPLSRAASPARLAHENLGERG
jgi:hypothetical protein